MPTHQDTNLIFLTSKGFDTTSLSSLKSALQWLQGTSGDNLMYGEGSGAEFDIMVGERRRMMLTESVERAIKEFEGT